MKNQRGAEAASSFAALFAAVTVVAARREGDEFQQVYAHQEKDCTWSLVGGGTQPLVVARP